MASAITNSTGLPECKCIIFAIGGDQYYVPRDAAVDACGFLKSCVTAAPAGDMPVVDLSLPSTSPILKPTAAVLEDLVSFLCMPHVERTKSASELPRKVLSTRLAKGVPHMMSLLLLCDYLHYTVLMDAIALDIARGSIQHQTPYQCIGALRVEDRLEAGAISPAQMAEFLAVPENAWVDPAVSTYLV